MYPAPRDNFGNLFHTLEDESAFLDIADTRLQHKSDCSPWKGGMRRIILYCNIANTDEFLDPLGDFAEDVVDE